MAYVHVLSAAATDPDRGPKALLDLEQMLSAARADRFGVHQLVDDPGAADVILFVETSTAAGPYFERVRSHPVYRRFRSKSYLFSSTDRVIPFLPGVYASVERRWYRRAWTRAGHYLGVRERAELRYDPGHRPLRLFSFVGAADTHPIRQRIMELRHPDGKLVDSRSDSSAMRTEGATSTGALARYAQAIKDSAFTLCPRGGGASTFRVFETMMLGRVPVIVSDQWVPPEGPDWKSLSIRVDERHVDRIPALLEARAVDADAMGEAARQAWRDWFSEGASFHRTVEWCLDLARFGPSRAGLRRFRPHAQMLRPYHLGRWTATRVRAVTRDGASQR